jgi:hypothetical protein
VIFSRRSRAGKHALTPAELRRAQRAALLEELELAPPPASVEAPAPNSATREADGPWDFDDAPNGDRVDLGSLLLPPVDGVEIRLRASEAGVIQQIELAHADNLLQLGVFAAPRHEGLWDEVRAEIRKSLFDDGVGADEVGGRWGVHLRARLRTPNGFDELRFIGIDGPRWMIRAVFQGPCAADLALAGPLWECLTGVVVRRDEQARPAREPLPLAIPPQAEEQMLPQEPLSQESLPQPARRKPSPRPRRD